LQHLTGKVYEGPGNTVKEDNWARRKVLLQNLLGRWLHDASGGHWWYWAYRHLSRSSAGEGRL
jgi:hypothetical protein